MKRPTNNRRRDNQHQQHRQPPQNRQPSRQTAPADIWIDPEPLPDFVPIDTSANALAMFRSLETPPVHGQGDVAKLFESVIERSAVIATALALSAGALADPRV